MVTFYNSNTNKNLTSRGRKESILCIAILQNEGAKLTRREIKNCWTNNPDGAGIAWVQDGEIKTHKEIISFKRFYKSYRDIAGNYGESSKMLVHFRWATHGYVNIENCHPHLVNNRLSFVHNGIIDIETAADKSDTVAFNERILKYLPDNFIHRKRTMKHVENRAKSILIFLDSDNSSKIIGEDKGIWDNNRWFSNYDFCHVIKDSYASLCNGVDYPSNVKVPEEEDWAGDSNDGTEGADWTKSDDEWERYRNEELGTTAKGIDYSSDSMQDMSGIVKTIKRRQRSSKSRKNSDDKLTRIRGVCFRCGCQTENLKLIEHHWHCITCIGEITGFTEDDRCSVGGICQECGRYDDDLIIFNEGLYCSSCYGYFSV